MLSGFELYPRRVPLSNIMIDHYDILLLLSTELRSTTID